MAVEKGTENSAKATEKLRTVREEKEQQQAQMQNELARIHVDALNTKSHISELEQQNKALNEELTEKDALVNRYQLEARRRAIEIEKKQHDLDLLNKKFDVLMKQRAGDAELDEDAGAFTNTRSQPAVSHTRVALVYTHATHAARIRLFSSTLSLASLSRSLASLPLSPLSLSPLSPGPLGAT